MSKAVISKQQQLRPGPPESVFVSYRFADAELVNDLLRLLKWAHFDVRTGNSANTFVSDAIIDYIESSALYVCVLTRAEKKADGTWTASPWLHQELGVARGFRKRFVLMLEEGVADLGGIQGDWQRINFTEKTFFKAALDAVEQLQSYLEQRSEPIVRHA